MTIYYETIYWIIKIILMLIVEFCIVRYYLIKISKEKFIKDITLKETIEDTKKDNPHLKSSKMVAFKKYY